MKRSRLRIVTALVGMLVAVLVIGYISGTRPGAMTGMANWLRAGAQYPRTLTGDATVRVPTRIVWGLKDEFADSSLARPSLARCMEANLVEIPGTGHWLLHEEPERTSQELIEFFRDEPRSQ